MGTASEIFHDHMGLASPMTPEADVIAVYKKHL